MYLSRYILSGWHLTSTLFLSIRCAPGEGMVFDLAVLNRVYTFIRLCRKQGQNLSHTGVWYYISFLFDLLLQKLHLVGCLDHFALT